MTCAICTDTLGDSPFTLECGHLFHVDCIVAWFRSGKSSCPMCRDCGQGDFVALDNLKYVTELSKMKSCPEFLKDAILDLDYQKMTLKKQKNHFFRMCADKSIPYNKIKQAKKCLKKRKKIYIAAKKYLSNAHIFWVPLKKHIYM